MSFYRTGTITLTNGSTAVTGSSTRWTVQAKAGDAIYYGDKLLEVGTVNSDTSITLVSAYTGTTATGVAYQLIPLSPLWSLSTETAHAVADLLNKYADINDTAETSATNAATWAEGTDAQVTALSGTHSAKQWAANAATSATAAAASQTGVFEAQTAAEAAQSAAEAAQSGAVAAKDAAVTAKNDAVSAKTAAETAQSAAETAQSGAETAEDHSEIWAEGTDAEVQALGGTHSAKVWAQGAGGITSVTVTGNGNVVTGASAADQTLTLTKAPFTASKAVVTDSDGKIAASDITDTELGYLDGVTSNIQTQLNSKLNGSGLTASSVLVTDSSGSATTGMTTTELNAKINATQGAIIIAGSPDYYSRSALATVTQTTVVMPSRLWVNVNDVGYVKSAAETLDLTAAASWDSTTTDYTTAANRAGKDFYIYACNNSGSLKYLLSANSTVPTGYTADTSRKIGGFHCLCVSVGTISGHTLSGYVAGDILPLSIWDLKHRPVSDPEGMVYVTGLGLWVDIYLASLSNGKLVSAYGGVVADGTSSTKFHGYRIDEYFGLIGKRTLWQREFEVASQGSNQCTNIYGSSDPNTTGGHRDTASRRMISNYGLEDCCGAYYQRGCDSAEYVPSAGYTSGNKNLTYSSWYDIAYDSSIESSQGQPYGIPRRTLLGGGWGNAAVCGSRCSTWGNVPSNLISAGGSRGASEPRHND